MKTAITKTGRKKTRTGKKKEGKTIVGKVLRSCAVPLHTKVPFYLLPLCKSFAENK